MIYEKVQGPEHPDVATIVNNLADLYRIQGKYKEAESGYQRALEMNEHVFGLQHPAVATNLNSLGVLYDGQGRYANAESYYQRALAI